MPTYPGGSPWKSSLKDSVSNRPFSDFKACVYCLTLTLTNTHTHTHTLSLSNQSTLTLRQNRPTLTVLASPTLPPLVVSLSQPHAYTLSVSHKPEHSYCVSLTHAIACPTTLSASPMPWSPSVCALKSFSLWKPKKKKVSPLWKFFFFFGFCFEFPIELLKKIEVLLFFEFGLCF